MKKNYTQLFSKSFISILFIFCLHINPSSAQITIERTDFTAEANDEIVRLSAYVAGIERPTEGSNQIWDYSDLIYANSYSYDFSQVDSHPNMPSVNLSYLGGISQFGGIVQPRRWYEELSSNRYATLGMQTEAISSSLQAETGNVNDSIYYLGELNIYEEALVVYKWPMNFNDIWSSTSTFNTETALTVTSLGLNKMLANQLSYAYDTRTVSGFGNLIIPNPNDTGVLNLEVLLLKTETRTVDSIFANGQPASLTFLNALNLEQAKVTNTVVYEFIGKDLPGSALYIEYEDSVLVFSSISNSVKNIVSNTSTLSEDDKRINIFPNPTTSATKIAIDNQWMGQVSIHIMNSLGQIVQSISLEKMNQKLSYDLALENLPMGSYSALISYEEKLLVKPFVKLR